MIRQTAIPTMWRAFIVLAFSLSSTFADPPTTAPAKLGDVDLTFPERSPLSAPKELAKRLGMKPTDITDDYDLSTKPYKAFIPTNYDPATPHGIFVYLGYKDSVGTPKQWQPILEKSRLIFITPVSHTSDQYEPTIPLWQTLGLAFDAVHNLKQQYNIDPARIYLMSFGKDSTYLSLVAGDIFTGFVIAADPSYSRKLTIGNRYYAASFPPPIEPYHRQGMRRAYFLLDTMSADDPSNRVMAIKIATMKVDGYKLIDSAPVSLIDDLHYPDFKAEWFEKLALPYLEKPTEIVPEPAPITHAPIASHTPPAAHTPTVAHTTTKPATTKPAIAHATTKPAIAPPTSAPAPTAVEQSPAAHALAMAQLLIKNGQVELARKKLQLLIETFPSDPEAAQAKQILQTLP